MAALPVIKIDDRDWRPMTTHGLDEHGLARVLGLTAGHFISESTAASLAAWLRSGQRSMRRRISSDRQ
jgi:hypothetical protein